MKNENWEYKVEYIAFIHNETCMEKEKYINEILIEQGNNGWELVQINNSLLSDSGVDGYMIFKRTA
ncbi:DUF4177 domain-containing protein [Clostridium minihomine]|uniref:DUF4177 domain-containing protein n=1 Tax=Clostridium minihomine TaxID=2045012 RepID=UPI000C763687